MFSLKYYHDVAHFGFALIMSLKFFLLYTLRNNMNVRMCFCVCSPTHTYRKTSNISRTLLGNKIVDNPDVVGASPVGAALTTSSFST